MTQATAPPGGMNVQLVPLEGVMKKETILPPLTMANA
jgi:hypothetical protein